MQSFTAISCGSLAASECLSLRARVGPGLLAIQPGERARARGRPALRTQPRESRQVGGRVEIEAGCEPHGAQAGAFRASQGLIEHVGVAAIPPSAFYHDPADGRSLVRFAFCKDIATLEEALGRMRDRLRPPRSV